jgi:hypothetical protein
MLRILNVWPCMLPCMFLGWLHSKKMPWMEPLGRRKGRYMRRLRPMEVSGHMVLLHTSTMEERKVLLINAIYQLKKVLYNTSIFFSIELYVV